MATATAPALRAPRSRPIPTGRRWWPPVAFALGVGITAALVAVWARTRPSFDAFGWLTWGHQTWSGSLDTNAAPSWKPLPYLFTALFAPAGHTQVYLWLWCSIAVSLAGLVFAFRIARRLTLAGGLPDARRRRGAIVAGLFAAIVLLGIQQYPHYILSAQSDPMIVALCLGAIDCHLGGRPRTALSFALLASLGRPEVWPFLGLYAVWAWRAVPAMRWLVVAEFAALAALWFGIPALTSRSAFVAGDNALGSARALHSNQVSGIIHRFLGLHAWPLEVTALLSVALAARRRERVVLALGAGVLVWVVVEIAFAIHGWAGLPRYMFEAAAVMVVIAAVLVGRALAGDLSGLVPARAALAAGALVAVAATGALVPTAVSAVRYERKDLSVQRLRTVEMDRLRRTIDALGGARALHPCGEDLVTLQWQSVLAWTLHLNVSRIGWKFPRAIASGRPVVLFSLDSADNWRVRALHQRRAGCLSLPS